MALHDLKQWRNQHESEQQAKIPILLLDHHHQQQQPSGFSAFPLFLHEPNSKISSSNLSAFPDSNIRLTRMGSYFSLAQWQELELQTLIYRYMLAGVAVPSELLQSFKKSLLHSPTYFLHQSLQHYPHYQPALLQSGYWGRAATDPEPGRCRRTDGKKWRCLRDVVAGQKYCESHVHRARNRSRKPVEMPKSGIISTTAIITNNNANAPVGGDSGAGVVAIGCGAIKASSPITASPLAMVATPNNFDLPRPSPPIDLLHPNHSCSESKNEHTGLFEAQNVVHKRSNCHVLSHFFDDWPRSLTRAGQCWKNASSMMKSILQHYSISNAWKIPHQMSR